MGKIIKIAIPISIIIFSIIIMSIVQFGNDELTNGLTGDSRIIREESIDVITVDNIMEEFHELHTVKMSSTSIFDIYYTEKDAELFRTKAMDPENGVKLEFNNKNSEFYQKNICFIILNFLK